MLELEFLLFTEAVVVLAEVSAAAASSSFAGSTISKSSLVLT